MMQPGRNYNPSDMTFGFQGQLMDNELKGTGNSYDFGERMQDPRLGRFFSPDPLRRRFPFYSPYVFSGNRVIDAVDFEGLQPMDGEKAAAASASLLDLFTDSDVSESTEAAQSHFEGRLKSEKANRLATDALIIGGGIVTIAATGGTGAPVVTALAITSGTLEMASGTAKLTADLAGNYEASDKVPTSYADATLGMTIKATVDDEQVSAKARGVIRFTEGVMTAKLTKIDASSSAIQKVAKGQSLTKLSIEAFNLGEAMMNQQDMSQTDRMTDFDPSDVNTGAPSKAPADNTSTGGSSGKKTDRYVEADF